MDKIVVEQEHFDFDQFSKEIVTFLSKRVSEELDPSFAIAVIEKLGENGRAEYGPESGWKDLLALLQKGKLLFFPFSDNYLGEPVFCVDGNFYPEKIDGKYQEDIDIEIGETDCYGYTLQLKKSMFHIHSSIHFGGYMYPMTPPHVELKEDCGVFDQPMNKFINRFLEE